ncbi:hypothetical protein [Anaerolentibacter hominis]|uniref:hypothetical protein n=1 Tax=Anaerolentibacter hominis TaxID=3079009 RepID=UPI0031B85799
MDRWEMYFDIIKINFRRNFLPSLIMGVLLLLFIPFLFGITELDTREAAMPLELMVSLCGILMMTTVFYPEQKVNVKDLAESKWIDHLLVCKLRLGYSAGTVFLFTGCFTAVMKAFGSQVTLEHFLGTAATAFFLGSLGAFACGLSGNIAIGYMVPLVYYLINYSSRAMGKFYLFSMQMGSTEEKLWLAAAGIVLLFLLFGIKRIQMRIR